MPLITIQGTPIDFPNSATAPNWAPAVIQFAEAVADALTSVVGTYDVSPRSLNIDVTPNGAPTDLPTLSFPTTQIRGAFIRYTVYRNTTAITVSETGEMLINYNPANGIGEKWQVSRDAVGDASVDFSVTDTGQVQFTLSALAGTNHTGTISYTSQALQQQY